MSNNNYIQNTTNSFKCSKLDETNNDGNGEHEPVPLPIQMFLWRQTNHFFGSKVGKLYEASCVTFERIVVQNVLYGLTPSLSSAFNLISRWRFVQASFPHIIHCCGALLAERINEEENFSMSGSLVKMLYILHWLLLDASAECNENEIKKSEESNSSEISFCQLTYSISSIQLFVYLLAPLFHTVKESDIEGHIRLNNGFRIWQALWKYQLPEILCFCAPVKQKKNYVPQWSFWTSKATKFTITAEDAGIYLGDESSTNNQSFSSKNVVSKTSFVPPPKPPRSNLSVLREIQQNQNSYQNIEQTTFNDNKKITEKEQNNSTDDLKKKNFTQNMPSFIIKSASNYKVLNNVENQNFMKKTKTHESFDLDNGEVLNFNESSSCSYSEIFQINDKAPLVTLNDICTNSSNDNSLILNDDLISKQKSVNNNKNLTNCVSNNYNNNAQTSSNKTINQSIMSHKFNLNKTNSTDDFSSTTSQDTKVAVLSKFKLSDTEKNKIEKLEFGNNPREATYLDVAVIRCLLIQNWAEEGVYWSIKYLFNRISDVFLDCQKNVNYKFRNRCNSLPENFNVSKNLKQKEVKSFTNFFYDNKETSDQFKKLANEKKRSKKEDFLNINPNKNTRRVSVNIIPVCKKDSKKLSQTRKILRSKSEPFNLTFLIKKNNFDILNNSAEKPEEFFPEATGSSTFIEKNGHLNLLTIVTVLSSLTKHGVTVRVLKIILNICELLLNLPDSDNQKFYEKIVKIIFRSYIFLGCSYGCNEGMQTKQADVLRIKLCNLLSLMHKLNSNKLSQMFKLFIEKTQYQKLLDCIHAMTMFCRIDNYVQKKFFAFSNYNNHFNEFKSGIEGLLLSYLLTPIITKLIKKVNDFFLPENMSLCQDVKMFVAYAQKIYGNSVRKTALSALSAKILKEDQYCDQDINNYQNEYKFLNINNKFGTEGFGSISSYLRDNASLRRGLFKKKEKIENVVSNAHDLNVEEDNEIFFNSSNINETNNSNVCSSPSTPKNLMSSVEETVSNVESPLLIQNMTKKKTALIGGGKLQFALSLLKSVKNENSEEDVWTVEDSVNNCDEISTNGEDSNSLTVSGDISKNRSSLKNSARQQNNFCQKPSLSTDNNFWKTIEENKLNESQNLPPYLPSRKFVFIEDVRKGAQRFSFLLTMCNPGEFPDVPLIGALCELKSPVLSRAVLLLECIYLVQRCNRGEWPEWTRFNRNYSSNWISQNNAYSLNNNGGISRKGLRKSLLFQKFAAKSFYNWAVQIAICISRIIEKEDSSNKKDEDKKVIRAMDDLEDFLNDGSVNDSTGEYCPPALLLLCCMLLYKITSFLRKCFQTLPNSRTSHKNIKSGWEKLMSHRRWSIISNTFNQQTGSIHSINDLHPTVLNERRVSYSTADEESSTCESYDFTECSNKSSSIIQTEKKGRRLAQGRQRLLKKNSLVSHPQHQNTLLNRRQESIKCKKFSRFQTNSGVDFLTIHANEDMDNKNIIKTQNHLNFYENKCNVSNSTEFSTSNKQLFKQYTSPATSDNVQFCGEKQSQPSSENAQNSTNNISPLLHGSDEEDDTIIKNMPWINVLVIISNRFNMDCTHESCCDKWCFERVYRQCKRLNEALLVIYEDSTIPPKKKFDKWKYYVTLWRNHHYNKQKKTSNSRQENTSLRQSNVEKMPSTIKGLLMDKLNEIDEIKTNAKKKDTENNDININFCDFFKKPTSMQNFIKIQLHNILHAPFSGLLKSAIVMEQEHYKSMIKISWTLLTNFDANIVSSAAAMFICCAVKCGDECVNVMKADMTNLDPTCKTQAIRRFFALWKNRFHVWLKMEENAQMLFKVPPPVIDFTSPSPPIGQSQLPVVDAPWMPYTKTKLEELTLKEEEHSTSQTIMTMTRTRRKQKQEMVKRAVQEVEERQSELRSQYLLNSIAIVQLAAYEPALFYQPHIQPTVVTNSQQPQQQLQQQLSFQQQLLQTQQPFHHPQNLNENDLLSQSQIQQSQQLQNQQQSQQIKHQYILPVAQPLLPSSILNVVPLIIEMFDNAQIDKNGFSVGDICRNIAWNCIIEDTSLFLRNFLEKLTDFSKQEYLMTLLRKLIITFQPLPSQMAYTLLNYLFGFIMFYVRSPCEGSNQATSLALSLTWLIAPYVNGLYFKDLKQTLKKEQCDQAIMITANVPAAKKIIVHGPDSSNGGIPSQFPIMEDTQFQQILTDSLDFFNIPEKEIDQYFLIDSKTGVFHNPNAYVRDFYFFHRSFYPQLLLIKYDTELAKIKIRENAFLQKFIEVGKCLLTHSALKYSNIPQRIFFLHDEFTHLPSFPRRSVESCFGMYQGVMGPELLAMDSIHKFMWSNLMSDMFEKMENAFMFNDLHLFINVINGIMIIHCEDILILRRCMATYITMAIHFSTLFSSQGFFLIMPTILRCYSQRQTNRMFAQVVEFVCKQFYILHRKPFLLQMFGSIAEICDQVLNDLEINAMQVKAKYLFNLLLSMENMTELDDQIDILTLVQYPKPLKALDLCYKEDPNSFFILTDALASCVTVCAFAPESKRSYQMLLIIQAIIPSYLKHLENESLKNLNNPAAIKHEINCYTMLCVEIKALVNSCESLARGPTRIFDIVNSVNERGKSFLADSPQFFDSPTFVDDEITGKTNENQTTIREKKQNNNGINSTGVDENSEIQKEIFRGLRNSLLTLCSLFIVKANVRFKELSKLILNSTEYSIRIPELFDHKCYQKLSEIAVSLLKIAPYDLNTLSCTGLQKFFLHILPIVDWSIESNRSVLNVVLRRLDKTITKIAKRSLIKRRVSWGSISNWIDGLYKTLVLYPYIAHFHPVKTITQLCLRLTIGDQCNDDLVSNNQLNNQAFVTILNPLVPSSVFCNNVLKLTSFLMQALGQSAFSLEYVCSADCLGQLSESTEAVLCYILIPLFLRAAIPGKEALQLHPKDLNFCLNYIYNVICPPKAKQSLALISNPTINRDITGRQGSVSVTDRGLSATVLSLRIVRDSVTQAVILALKIIVVVFQKQMLTFWVKVAKIVKELLSKKTLNQSLLSFINFLLNANLPISLIIQPIIYNKITQRPANEHEANWQNEIREFLKKKFDNVKDNNFNLSPNNIMSIFDQMPMSINDSYCVLNKLYVEFQALKDDFCNRQLETLNLHNSTAGDLHSDSASSISTSFHPNATNNTNHSDHRRLSTSAVLAKLRNVTNSGKDSIASSNNKIPLVSTKSTQQYNTLLNQEEPFHYDSFLGKNKEDFSGLHFPIHTSQLNLINMQKSFTTFRKSTLSLQKTTSEHISKNLNYSQTNNSVKNEVRKKKYTLIRQKSSDLNFKHQNKHSHKQLLNFERTSISALDMFRNVRQNKPFKFDIDTTKILDIPKLGRHHRSKSLNKRLNVIEKPVIVTPLVKTQITTDLSNISHSPTNNNVFSEQSSVSSERLKVVSFSTPKKSLSFRSTSETDSNDCFCITSEQHII